MKGCNVHILLGQQRSRSTISIKSSMIYHEQTRPFKHALPSLIFVLRLAYSKLVYSYPKLCRLLSKTLKWEINGQLTEFLQCQTRFYKSLGSNKVCKQNHNIYNTYGVALPMGCALKEYFYCQFEAYLISSSSIVRVKITA